MSVEKSAKAKARQKEVATTFEAWLKSNPKANRKRQFNAFNAISDSAYLNDILNKENGRGKKTRALARKS